MLRSILILMLVMRAVSADAASFDHSQWDGLLKNNVVVYEGGKATKVDYQAMARERQVLTDYFDRLAKIRRAQFDSWPKDEQLAFLINAYNGWTVELILTRYPDLQSIKELGFLFQSPWKKEFIPLLGEKRSLDDIEHGLIRGSGRYNDPRIHFAVNCASIGCPALRNQAYRGDILDKQLEEATALFLSDRSRNRLSDGELQVSSIFKWYREDFERGWRGAATLAQFLSLYKDSLGLDDAEAGKLVAGNVAIRFLEYDWKLNSTD
ncbi:DUF547 domain-containing protein [Desulfocastanea catecholica]